MTYVLGGNVLATVTVYKDYRGLKTIYSQVDKIDIRYLGSKSSSTRIDAVFIDSDGQIYDMNLINGDKRMLIIFDIISQCPIPQLYPLINMANHFTFLNSWNNQSE